ncbi:TonB-dependent receptor domain-containing protein [Aliikangiella marina]|nr:TonB-dependent receptor [Aliikangiella marina]
MKDETISLKSSLLRNAIRSALALSAIATFNINAVYAAEEEEVDDEATRITVTGSRIRRDSFASPSPIQVLSADDALKAGINNISDMLQKVTLANGPQIDATINTNSGNSNATEAPPAGGVGSRNVGLRGLGAERTLILINGRRLGASGVRGAPSQPDLSLIPFDMVERVEVLSDSASAIYGADAVAGVVNIILKKNMEGVKISANFSAPDDPGGETRQVSFVTGAESDRTTFIFGGEFYDRERISTGSRVDCVRRREINTDTNEIYSYCYNGFPDNTLIAPATAGAGQHGSVWNFYTPGQSNVLNGVTGLPVPNWSGSANIPPPSFGYAPFLDDPTGNDRFRLNPDYNDNYDRMRSDLVQPLQRFSLVASGTWRPEWGQDNGTEIFYDTSYFHRNLNNRATAEQLYPVVPGFIPQENGNGGLLQNPDGSLDLSAQNPLNPFGFDVLPVVTLDDLKQDREVELDHFRFGFGFRGDLPFDWAKEKGWNYEVAASYDRGDGVATQPAMNENHLIFAMETLRLDADGNLVCGIETVVNNGIGGIIKPESCVPIDWLNPSLYTQGGASAGSFSTQAERDYLIGERVNRTVVEQSIISGFVTGDLFSFDNGGTASLVLGMEYRKDTIDSQVDFLGQNGLIVAENPATEGITAGSRSVQEVFSELSLPILSGVEGAEELTLDLAVRFTDESNFGDETTERVRLTYAPVDWMSFSTAYGTSFRAPNLREQYLGDQFGGTAGGNDPCNVNNAGPGWDGTNYDPNLDTRSATVLANCNADGVDPTQLGTLGTTTIPVRTGGNVSDLRPETAEQLTFTFKAAPVDTADYSFDFAITYFDILIEDTIQALDPAFILTRCYNDLPNLASPFCGRVGVRDQAVAGSARFPNDVDASFVNIGEQTSVGYDINTRFQVNFDDVMGESASLVWGTQITLQDELTTTIIEDPTLFNNGTDDLLGTFGNPETRAVTSLSFNRGDWTYTYSGRYVSETEIFIRDPSTSASTCLLSNAAPSTRITGAPNVIRDCVAESKFYSDISVTWSPDETFVATVGVTNIGDVQPAQVSAGLGSDRAGRMVAAGYDQIGRSLFANLSYKF